MRALSMELMNQKEKHELKFNLMPLTEHGPHLKLYFNSYRVHEIKTPNFNYTYISIEIN